MPRPVLAYMKDQISNWCTDESKNKQTEKEAFQIKLIIFNTIKLLIKIIKLLFYCSSLNCASDTLCFLKIQSLWQSCIKLVYKHHFSNSICSLLASVSHFNNSIIIVVFVMMTYDHWSLMLLLFLGGTLWTTTM